MKVLILEGIATSGKSTLTKSIKAQLPDLTVRTVTEEETHLPIMNQPNKLHVSFFENLIKAVVAEKPHLIIFDRLYLTQAFRASRSLDEYATIEELLTQFDTLTVFLKIDEQAIAERVAQAALHRDPSWGEYIKTKGDSNEEIAKYYITQQRHQLKLLESSKLPHIICNTTDNDYPAVTLQILKKFGLDINPKD